MKALSLILSLTLLLPGLAAAKEAAPGGMARVGPGKLRLLYPPSPEEAEVEVAAFGQDRLPVTNADFLSFVRAHPEWGKDRAGRLFVGEDYLGHWEGPTSLGAAAAPGQPVTRVSWFAAKAYCAARGARLPTETEWEFAASASETKADASDDAAFLARILSWYARPGSATLPAVGASAPNFWGIRDLHGLVWEWVYDFGSTLVSGDSRESGDPDKARFCGAGAVSAADKGNYAGFMRIAFRSSLGPAYTTGSLGFRCARDLAPAKEAK